MHSRDTQSNIRHEVKHNLSLPDVTTRKNQSVVQATLRQIAGEPEFASSIVSLSLEGGIGRYGGSYSLIVPFHLILEALRNLSTLKSLILHGQILETAEQQGEFVRVLNRDNSTLEEFRWLAHFHSFPSPGFSLRNLKTLEWSIELPSDVTKYNDYKRALPSILEASKETLQFIVVHLSPDRDDGGNYCFWDFRFPKLQVLRLRNQDPDQEELGWTDKATEFFSDHLDMSFEELKLDFGGDDYNDPCTDRLIFHRPTSREDEEFRVRKLVGGKCFLWYVAQKLNTDNLEELWIRANYSDGDDDPIVTAESVVGYLAPSPTQAQSGAYAGYHRLRSLYVELRFDKHLVDNAMAETYGTGDGYGSGEESEPLKIESERLIGLFGTIGKFCGGSLENLSLIFVYQKPDPIPVQDLVAALNLCLRLKTILLPRNLIGEHPNKKEVQSYLSALALGCQGLDAVRVEHSGGLRKYQITREGGTVFVNDPVVLVPKPPGDPVLALFGDSSDSDW